MNWDKTNLATDKTLSWFGILSIACIACGSFVLGMAWTAYTVAPILDEPPLNLYHHYAIGRMIISFFVISMGIVILSVTRLDKSPHLLLGIAAMAFGSFILGMEYIAWGITPILEGLGYPPFYLYHPSVGMIAGFTIILMGIVIFVKKINLSKVRNQNEQ